MNRHSVLLLLALTLAAVALVVEVRFANSAAALSSRG
jgi:hypothetical protein